MVQNIKAMFDAAIKVVPAIEAEAEEVEGAESMHGQTNGGGSREWVLPPPSSPLSPNFQFDRWEGLQKKSLEEVYLAPISS